jgi:hypothetical protein
MLAAALSWHARARPSRHAPTPCSMSSSSELLRGVDGKAITFPQLAEVLQSLEGTKKEVVSVRVTSELLQPGSHSGVLHLTIDGGETSTLFLKKIAATHEPLAQRPWPDRRRTLAYARTEARFYEEFAADEELAARLARLRVRLPRLALSDNTLDVVLGDAAVHEAAGDEPSAEAQAAAGAVLFLEECAEGFRQVSPLNEPMARQALRAVAGLHASCWEDEPLLRRASERLQRHGGVYALEIRSPAERTRLKPNWDAFVSAFRAFEPELFDRPSVAALGERLDRWTAFASEQLSPQPTDRFATLVHGDCKAMNVMLPRDEEDESTAPWLFDFASTGVGLGMCDVAMLLAHSVEPETLADGGLERLLDVYLDALEQNGVQGYDRTDAMRHFHLATVDYARFVVSRFWSGASEEAFAKRATNPNVCLPNRSVEAAMRFVERVDASLTALDGGGGTCC